MHFNAFRTTSIYEHVIFFQTHFSLQKLQQIPSVLVRVFFAENDLLFDIQTKSFRRKVTDFLT